MILPEEEHADGSMHTYRELCAQLAVSLGGPAAEALLLGETSNAGADDLQHVRSLARAMVAQWGFATLLPGSPLAGVPVAWEAPDGRNALGGGASERTEAALDDAVRALVDGADRLASGEPGRRVANPH